MSWPNRKAILRFQIKTILFNKAMYPSLVVDCRLFQGTNNDLCKSLEMPHAWNFVAYALEIERIEMFKVDDVPPIGLEEGKLCTSRVVC